MPISRCARLRFTPSVTAIRRLPKKGHSRYNSSSRRISRRFSALSGSRLVVVGRARQTQQFALLFDGQARMFGIDP